MPLPTIRQIGVFALAALALCVIGWVSISNRDCPPERLIGDNYVPGVCL